MKEKERGKQLSLKAPSLLPKIKGGF